MMDFVWNGLHWFFLALKAHNPPVLYIYNGVQTLCAPSELPPKPPGSVRLVVVSDTHARHSLVHVPPGDVLCHCGDILFSGRRFSDAELAQQYADFNEWLGRAPCPTRIVIAGNHDCYLEKIGSTAAQQLLSNAVYLCNTTATLPGLGLTVLGTPLSHGSSRNSAFQSDLFEEQAHAALAAAPRVDVLLTHGPQVRSVCAAVPGLQLHLWGHVHGAYGAKVTQANGGAAAWLSVCASSLDAQYAATNGAVVVDLEIRSADVTR
eukprot:TRINITY_DN19196_c0_g1_i1.p2 TRINITY_DN19196_c0_g1~~TRINITY_DN19196_c0_g1_i1.p2  ORF type:complete len:289 (-),score=75.66 TRINITY_DN19196_c0_g1_i1:90-878(-)